MVWSGVEIGYLIIFKYTTSCFKHKIYWSWLQLCLISMEQLDWVVWYIACLCWWRASWSLSWYIRCLDNVLLRGSDISRGSDMFPILGWLQLCLISMEQLDWVVWYLACLCWWWASWCLSWCIRCLDNILLRGSDISRDSGILRYSDMFQGVQLNDVKILHKCRPPPPLDLDLDTHEPRKLWVVREAPFKFILKAFGQCPWMW